MPYMLHVNLFLKTTLQVQNLDKLKPKMYKQLKAILIFSNV